MTHGFNFGTVGAPMSTPKKPGGSVGAIQHLKALNLGAFELGWVQSVRVSEETCFAIKEAGIQQEIPLSVHAPYFINLNADDEEWPKSRKRLMDAAHFGAMAGATDIIFHPGSYFEQPREAVIERCIIRLAGCVDELRAEGNPVILRPETMGKSAMIGSLQDTLDFSKAITGVLPCLDFAHLHARAGDGSMNSYNEWSTVLHKISTHLGEDALKNLHIHLSGIEYSLKGERNHLPLKESDFLLEDLFRALKDFHCAGRILCESPEMEDDALYMQNTWAELNT